ncbi:hypothetical protein [Curtobacterium sp. L1-20]|uniref:hypothetical protein n=1 Tax=Curtobacterium sp. L1-20 TaxID=3138181 RepID=UPI003B517B62
MSLMIGLVLGLAFGLSAAGVGRRAGTVLNVVPIVAWFTALAVMLRGGLSDQELAQLGAAIVGILVGLFCGQLFERRRAEITERRASSSGR